MIVNKYKKKCQSCNKMVDVDKGFAYKNGSVWLTVCASAACHRHLGVTAPGGITNKKSVRKITADGKIYMPYDSAAVPLIRSLPGAKFNPDNLPKDQVYWQVSIKPADLQRVIEVSSQLKLDIANELIERLEEGTEESRAALARAELIYNGKKLYDFQKEGVKFLALHDRGFLADDMGLGKTLQAIIALPENERVLVICPASLKYNWRKEICMWRGDSYKITLCNGKEETYLKALEEGKKTKIVPFKIPDVGEIVICNYDILPSYLLPTQLSGNKTRAGKDILVANLTDEQKKAFGEIIVIGDEFQLLKNYKTSRSKKVSQITCLAAKVWALSGTPLMNRPMDLFGVLSCGDMNVFGSWDNFLRLFNGYKNQWGGYEFGMPSPEVPERLQRVILRRLKSEVLKDLPTKIYKDIEIDIDGTINKKLDSFVTKAIGKSVDFDDEDSYENIAEDLPNFTEFSEIRALLAKSRIPALIEIVESYEESETPLVVFSAHKEPIETIGQRDGWRYITGDTKTEDRDSYVTEFQEGKLKGIALTIKTGGVGVTLTKATNMIFVDMDWVPSWNLQAEDRLVRIGATSNSVLVMRMSSNHPLDRHVQKLLVYKTELAYLALEASIKFTPPKPRGPGVDIIEETDEERLARIESVNDSVTREIALTKLNRIVARESEKVSDVPEPALTPNRKEMLRNALDYMVSVCDGAETRDAQGFNKPDAFIARWVGSCLRDEDEVSYRVLERILVRYRRQLKGKFEEIWKPE